MKTIAHISDLHFGRDIPHVAEALAADLTAQHPTLVVASGDLTQRARGREFRAAHDYLARLPHPQLVVPGNHDVPLYDVARRFLAPLTRYCRFIDGELDATRAAEVEAAAWFPVAELEAWIAARPEDFASGFIECWKAASGKHL